MWRVWVCGGCGRFRCMEGVASFPDGCGRGLEMRLVEGWVWRVIIVKKVWGMYGIYVCGWIQSWIC